MKNIGQNIALLGIFSISFISDSFAEDRKLGPYTHNNVKVEDIQKAEQPRKTDPIRQVKVGGYLQFQAGGFDDHHSNVTSFDFSQAGEIHIRSLNRSESGLEYGAYVQLRVSTTSRIAADEAKIFIRGDWGTISLGDEDGPADTLAVYAPNTGFGQAVTSFGQSIDGSYQTFLAPESRVQIGPKALDSGDSTKIVYMSPRLYGLRMGLSYAPEFDEGENIVRNSREELSQDGGNSGNTAVENRGLIDYIQPNLNSGRASASDNVSRGNPKRFFTRSFENFFEFGGNLALPLTDDFVWILSGGYVHAEQKSNATALDKRHPISAYSIGTQFVWQGFKIGGGYVNNGDSGQLKSFKKQDRKAYNVGIAYDVGRFGVALNYLYEDFGGTGVNGSGQNRAYGAGVSYHLVKGLMLGLDGVYFKREFGSDPLAPNLKVVPSTLKASKSDDEGFVVVAGTRLLF